MNAAISGEDVQSVYCTVECNKDSDLSYIINLSSGGFCWLFTVLDLFLDQTQFLVLLMFSC